MQISKGRHKVDPYYTPKHLQYPYGFLEYVYMVPASLSSDIHLIWMNLVGCWTKQGSKREVAYTKSCREDAQHNI